MDAYSVAFYGVGVGPGVPSAPLGLLSLLSMVGLCMGGVLCARCFGWNLLAELRCNPVVYGIVVVWYEYSSIDAYCGGFAIIFSREHV